MTTTKGGGFNIYNKNKFNISGFQVLFWRGIVLSRHFHLTTVSFSSTIHFQNSIDYMSFLSTKKVYLYPIKVLLNGQIPLTDHRENGWCSVLFYKKNQNDKFK